MHQPSNLQPAYLLHRRPYANSSLLVECFSATQGRFPAIVKGVMGSRRRRGGSGQLQPFLPMLIHCSGRGEVKHLTHYEALAPAVALAGRALYCGFYLNELLMRLLQRNDPHETLFAHYAETLGRLSGEADLQQVLRLFEVALLQELGYGLVLDREVQHGQPLQPQRRYQYLFEQGPVAASGNDPSTVHGATLLALHRREPLDPQSMREARQLLRGILGSYLGEKPLKSRELFRSLGRPAG